MIRSSVVPHGLDRVVDAPQPRNRQSIMRRAILPLLGLGCFLGLLLFVYHPVLFEDEQFAGGNASYFDYPLYLRVRQEWHAGRWPLWDPGQNGGTPLLGNPMAAVLYPVKVLHVLLPYAWGVRLYVIAHTAIAFFGLLALGRSFDVSWVGSCLGGLSYALGRRSCSSIATVIFWWALLGYLGVCVLSTACFGRDGVVVGPSWP